MKYASLLINKIFKPLYIQNLPCATTITNGPLPTHLTYFLKVECIMLDFLIR